MVKIFVGRLSPTVTPAQLRQLFENYGVVSDCDVLRDYGFVHMPHESEACQAIEALDKSEFCSSRLSVELSTSRSMKSCQLVVKNLPNGVSSQDLHKLFKKFGTVTLCRINKNSSVVHMRFPSMATNAIRNLSGELYRGNVLSVEFANNPGKQNSEVITKQDSFVSSNTNGDNISGYEAEANRRTVSHSNLQSWNQQKPGFHKQMHENSNSISGLSSTSPPQPNKTSELRDGRRLRIRQGLQFLQSPMPWTGTTELYETFLNQLKQMLLDEGLDLFREGFSNEAIAQLSEAINISNYMKTEGIKGYFENQDRLYHERAVLKLNMGNTAGALQDIDEALNVSGGANQHYLRFKARILVDCERRTDAFRLLLNFQQVYQLEPETVQLMKILKQSMTTAESESERLTGNKGAIGDGRNRTIMTQNSFPDHHLVNQGNFNMAKPMWPVENGASDNVNSFTSPFGNFNERGIPPNESHFGKSESHFQKFFNPEPSIQAPRISFPHNSSGGSLLGDTLQRPVTNSFLDPQLSSGQPSSYPHASSSLFSSEIHNCSNQQSSLPELSVPLPIGFQRPQSSSFSSIGSGPWNDNPSLGLGNKSSVDKSVDEELARAIEDELSASISNNLTFAPPDQIWHNTLEQHQPSSNDFLGSIGQDKSAPGYSHFSSDPSKGGYTGSVLGPAMLGIQTSGQTNLPKPVQQVKPPTIEPPKPATPPQPPPSAQNLMDANDSLSEILRNPLHDTHEFKLGCNECVLRTGSRVVDFRHDENLAHSCHRNIILCRRRGSGNWLKIRPRPQPQSKAQLYDGPYYICKDLMSGQDCTYPAVCTFAYNQEEIDVWTLERKGMLNRAWLCKSMDPDFVKNLSLVGLMLCKHRGSFDFLCKVCFQNKPRIISKFNHQNGKCTNTSTPHRGNTDNKQLTHIVREATVRYVEIRVPNQQAILCRHAIRFQCTRGSDCHFAHSLVERDVWAVMDKEGLTADDVVAQSNEHIKENPLPADDSEAKSLFASEGSLADFRWKVKFICSLCHKNGQVNEATKDMKYCTARAQHSWTSNKKVMLVNTKRSWVQVRDLPYLKNKTLPVRFELCDNYRRQKKCSFSGKCNFAHSQEELEIWMFLRENQLKDIEELREALVKDKQAKQAKSKASQSKEPASVAASAEAVPQSAFHCWLCDKECNSKRQWQKHCQSEKHKQRALSDSDGHWRFRNPGGKYKICERHEKGLCSFGRLPASENSCPFAHSKEELDEWLHRRQYVITRFRKAQDDQLIDSSQDMDNFIKQSTQS